MNELARFLAAKVAYYWHNPVTGILSALVGAGLVLMWVSEGTQKAVRPLGIVLVTITALGIGLLWILTNRLPRTPKGKVGIIVAVASEDEEQDKQFRADFIENLRLLLHRNPEASNLHLIVLPRHAAKRVDRPDMALRYTKKLRGHFMLYGRIRKRQIRGRDSHLLNFEGLVMHAPVAANVQKDLQADFNTVLPRRVAFEEDNDAFAFEATSEWTDVSARYIIGMAALMSGAVGYAETLLLDVERQLRGRSAAPPLREIARRLPGRFKALYDTWLRHLIGRYTLTREREYLEKGDEVANKLLKRDPRHYPAMLMKAISEFVLRRDVTEARRLILRCRRIRDATWRWSLAFLHAYEGNVKEARAEYDRAFRGRIDDVTVPIQAEEFIQLVLEEEPHRTQLHYCTGLINFFVKEDFDVAQRDFQHFIENVPSGQFIEAVAEAMSLLEECKAIKRDSLEP